MNWTDDQWAMFTAILSRGFAARDPFTAADADVYRLLLDGIDPDAAITAVREIVLEGKALRPRPGEIVERCRRDRSRPTFDEAYLLIYGQNGALRARPLQRVFDSATDRRSAEQEAILTRAAELHPLIGAFIVRQGIDRLRNLPLDDETYGELRRKELREAWEKHVEMFDGRELAAVAAGDPARTGLRKFDPLAALGISTDDGQRRLGAGDAA